MKLAARLEQATPLLTLTIDAKAKDMKADSMDVISFSIGEPDFNTPTSLRAAAKAALEASKNRDGGYSHSHF